MAERLILHLDMDAFFAAVEQRDRPELRGKPVIIGRPGPRGVVATCSYEARRFGVRSAMPSVTAERLCPQGIWVRGRMDLYGEVSHRIFRRMTEEVPVVEQVSVDEAYGDLTGFCPGFPEAETLARRIKEHIRSEERLTASAGVAACRFLAKVASDLEKPDGLTVIQPEQAQRILAPLPVRVIPGVGPRLAQRLAVLGVAAIGDLERISLARLNQEVGPATAYFLKQRALGEDDTPVEPHAGRKQVSEERTYGADLRGHAEVERELFLRAEAIAAALRDREVLARAVTLKIRDNAYRTVTRTHTLEEPTDLAMDLYQHALALWRQAAEFHERGIRLLGLAAKELITENDVTPSLFPDERRARARSVARATDALREKFGEGSILPARLLPKKPK